MNKSYKFLREKKVTDIYCEQHKIYDVIEILKQDRKSKLWDKIKENWTVNDWKEFFRLKANIYQHKINNK